MSKLWIIGDSFTGCSSDGKSAWVEIIAEKFKGNYYVSSKGSRDYQTVVDIFLRNLKNIKKDDLVILTIPTLERTRLPLKTPDTDVEYSNEFTTYNTKKNIINYFIGPHNYQNIKEKQLEEPLTNLVDDFFNNKSFGLTDKLWTIVNTSNANIKNVSEILDSIKSFVPFQLYIWSWADELNAEFIENRKIITEKIGFWESDHILWQKTNGEFGKKDDFHFSPKMHKAFADYVIVKFPQFFNV